MLNGSRKRVLSPLAVGYNLARGLTRNDQDAEDLVQELHCAPLGPLIAFAVANGRAWLLTIFTNSCCTQLSQNPTKT